MNMYHAHSAVLDGGRVLVHFNVQPGFTARGGDESLYVMVVDTTGGTLTLGSPVLVETTPSGNPGQVVLQTWMRRVDAGRVVLVARQLYRAFGGGSGGPNSGWAWVVVVDGLNASIGTKLILHSGSGTPFNGSGAVPAGLEVLSSSQVAVAFYDSTTIARFVTSVALDGMDLVEGNSVSHVAPSQRWHDHLYPAPGGLLMVSYGENDSTGFSLQVASIVSTGANALAVQDAAVVYDNPAFGDGWAEFYSGVADGRLWITLAEWIDYTTLIGSIPLALGTPPDLTFDVLRDGIAEGDYVTYFGNPTSWASLGDCYLVGYADDSPSAVLLKFCEDVPVVPALATGVIPLRIVWTRTTDFD